MMNMQIISETYQIFILLVKFLVDNKMISIIPLGNAIILILIFVKKCCVFIVQQLKHKIFFN
jgi:hypothetical protein